MKLIKAVVFLFGVCSLLPLTAQTPATTPAQIQKAMELQEKMKKTSLVKNLRLENIGPSIMSGRVVDLDVNPDRPTEFFVAYASGGLWYTQNNGTSFVPVLDQTPTQNLGDIAVHWASGTIYVGTGENNASRSSYAGIGILKSSDLGKTWSYSGLPDSHHIGRIVIHPDNPDRAVVAVLGHLYSPSEERGIYKTSDGGKTWKRTLFINQNTGMIDLVAAPENPEVLFAASWERDRKAWDFKGSGPGSGIYKSNDGGDSWSLITTEGQGFPTGAGVGRIGLTAYDANTVYAILDNQSRRPKTKDREDSNELDKEDLRNMTKKEFEALENSRLNTFLKSNGFPKEYKADSLKEMIRNGSLEVADLVRYLEDPNTVRYDTPVIGAEVYRSSNGGESWNKTHKGYIEDLYYSYGYFFGQIRVAPYNEEQIYIVGVPILRSDDGGASFHSINGENVHVDHHALWVNPNMEGHLVNGNDGGVNITYDFGSNWIKNNTPTVGQFYAINIDLQEPYNVYGGLQDNGVWKGPHNTEENLRWHQSGSYSWESIMGGDGMQVQIDSRNPDIVYTGYQFGNYFRIDLSTGKRNRIQPKHPLGQTPYRFNWQTPILLSPHNQDILYLGSHKLHRSMNQGTDWKEISSDLTGGGEIGNVSYGTLTSISESPIRFGLLYTGSDDGIIQGSTDGGIRWNRLSDNLPQKLWVSRVVASSHVEERVYAALNGYRWDDFTPYLYSSDDFGKTWKSIAPGIPAAPVNAIVEDPVNENLLFAGTDNGLYVSLDRGETWNAMQNGMPHVAIHDLVIQPKSGHLLVGTHGRSIYKADIRSLQKLHPEDLNEALIVFDLSDLKHSGRWGNSYSTWMPPSSPGLDIVFYSQKGGNTTARIQTADGIVVSESELQADPGINVISYDVTFTEKGMKSYRSKYKAKLEAAANGKTYLPEGAYKVVLSNSGNEETQAFKIK